MNRHDEDELELTWLRRLGSENASIRGQAANDLASQMRIGVVSPTLVAFLISEEHDDHVRAEVAWALGEIAGPQLANFEVALQAGLTDRSSLVRFESVVALRTATIPLAKCAAHCFLLLDDDNPRVSSAAIQSILSFDAEVFAIALKSYMTLIEDRKPGATMRIGQDHASAVHSLMGEDSSRDRLTFVLLARLIIDKFGKELTNPDAYKVSRAFTIMRLAVARLLEMSTTVATSQANTQNGIEGIHLLQTSIRESADGFLTIARIAARMDGVQQEALLGGIQKLFEHGSVEAAFKIIRNTLNERAIVNGHAAVNCIQAMGDELESLVDAFRANLPFLREIALSECPLAAERERLEEILIRIQRLLGPDSKTAPSSNQDQSGP